jgi:hypothetical protein
LFFGEEGIGYHMIRSNERNRGIRQNRWGMCENTDTGISREPAPEPGPEVVHEDQRSDVTEPAVPVAEPVQGLTTPIYHPPDGRRLDTGRPRRGLSFT